MANGRCRMHGGKARRGIDHPNFRTGKYIESLPTRLSETYERAQNDTELLDLRDDLRLLDARLVDLVKRVDTAEAGYHWRHAREALSEFKAATRDQDSARAMDALNDLTGTINKGVLDYAAWDELLKTLEKRVRVVEAINKQMVQAHQMMSIDQLMVLAAQFADIAMRHIHDPKDRASFGAEFSALVHRGDLPALPVGRE